MRYTISNDIDLYFMRKALRLALQGEGKTSPNPMVGALIVQQGQIIGRGFHARAGSPHAEILALQQAGDNSRGATLYVTLEPCSHHGRTPPCVDSVIASGVKRVVAAMGDPNPLVSGRGFSKLRRAGVEVNCGVLENEARRINEVFIKYIQTRNPFVVMKAAISLDGKIATANGESKWISSPNSRQMVHHLRNKYDAVMIGVETAIQDDPLLTTRLSPEIQQRSPVRIIVDSKLRLPLGSKLVLTASQSPVIVATTANSLPEKRSELEARGVDVILLPDSNDRVSLSSLMDCLGSREISSVLIEGGATVNAAALESGIVDKVLLFFAPILIGGTTSPGFVGGAGCKDLASAWSLESISIKNIGPDLLFEGYVK